jgi:hypothetical protein
MTAFRLGLFVVALGLAGCGGKGEKAQSPIPVTENSRPPFAEWVSPILGKKVTVLFPQHLDCKGYVDVVTWRYRGPKPGSQVQGWGWDSQLGKPFDRIVFTVDGKIVGGGGGGRSRPDVPRAITEIRSMTTGWSGETSETDGTLTAWGVDAVRGGACSLGQIAL